MGTTMKLLAVVVQLSCLAFGYDQQSTCDVSSRAKCFHNYQLWKIPIDSNLAGRFSRRQWKYVVDQLEHGKNYYSIFR